MKLTIHDYVVSKLIICGDILLLHLYVFVRWTDTTLPLPFIDTELHIHQVFDLRPSCFRKIGPDS